MAENLNKLEEETKTTQENPEDKTKKEVHEENKKEKGPDRNQLLRELSKEYGVNLFDPEGIKEFKKYQDSQKTELEKIREELEAARVREDEAKAALETQKLNNLRIKHGVNEEKFADFLAIATAKVNDDITIEKAFEETVKEYGALFVEQKQRDGIKLGIEVKENDPENGKVKSFDQEVFNAFLKRRK